MLIGLCLSTTYLLWGISAKYWMHARFTDFHKNQNSHILRHETKATAFNTLLWANVAETQEKFIFTYSSILSPKMSRSYTISKQQNLPNILTNHPKIKALKRISNDYFTIDTLIHGYRFNDWRFGQGVGWETGSGSAIFSYLITHQDTDLTILESPNRDRRIKDFLEPIPRFIQGNFE